MSGRSALKTGIVGYVYRGLRDGGVIAIATGAWMFGATLYPAMKAGRTEATVTGIEISCAFIKDLGDVGAMSGVTPDCSVPEVMHSGLVSEMTFAKLAYKSAIGAAYHSEIRVDDLKRPEVQRGDTVQIAYDRDDPHIVYAVPGFGDYVYGLALIVSGLLMLVMVWLARRAENYRGDVNAEVAALERAYRARAAGR
jgi:hypothetical protein